jgi:predicted nucleic acid-binding protein
MSALFFYDTCILIAYVRNNDFWKKISMRYDPIVLRARPTISVVTVGEIRAFAEDNKWGAKKRQRMKDCVGLFEVIEIQNDAIVNSFAEIDVWCKRNGRCLSDNDLWIAATAHHTGSHFISSDKDFKPLSPLLIDFTWLDPS